MSLWLAGIFNHSVSVIYIFIVNSLLRYFCYKMTFGPLRALENIYLLIMNITYVDGNIALETNIK